tara:strand:- start:4502 stop:5560 length:1059 start_codon:yes stop_codon:yes gene_type:complete
MGILRTFLAITVVLSHSYGHIFVGGRLAVQLFYIISGFLISYILIEAETYNSVRKFYWNRILRLFPAYYFISVLTFFVFLIQLSYLDQVDFFETFNQLNLMGKIYLILSNIFIIGQDFAFFMGADAGNLIFKSNYFNSEPVIYEGLISQITWTISLELTFYLIAPFILKDKKFLILILLLSILLRIILIFDGIGLVGGFTYRFFPLELALFLLGAFSHQFIKPYIERNFKGNMDFFSKFFTFFLLTYALFFSFIPGIMPNTLLIIFLTIIILPFLFHFQNINKNDQWIGKFSYPIYVSQWPVIVMAEDFFPIFSIAKLITILSVTLILAFLTEYFISSPIEKFRNKNKFSKN